MLLNRMEAARLLAKEIPAVTYSAWYMRLRKEEAGKLVNPYGFNQIVDKSSARVMYDDRNIIKVARIYHATNPYRLSRKPRDPAGQMSVFNLNALIQHWNPSI